MTCDTFPRKHVSFLFLTVWFWPPIHFLIRFDPEWQHSSVIWNTSRSICFGTAVGSEDMLPVPCGAQVGHHPRRSLFCALCRTMPARTLVCFARLQYHPNRPTACYCTRYATSTLVLVGDFVSSVMSCQSMKEMSVHCHRTIFLTITTLIHMTHMFFWALVMLLRASQQTTKRCY